MPKIDMKINSKMKSLQQKVDRQKNLALQDYARGELQDIQRRIVTAKTDPYGHRWAPWAFSTMRARMRDGTFGRGLLYKTGQLLRSITATIKGGEVTVSSSVPYAQYLQEGRANMRPRVIFDLGSKLSFNRLTKSLKKFMGNLK